MSAVDIQDVAHRHAELLQARSAWDATWADLATHFLPTRYRDIARKPDAARNPSRLNTKIVDSTGILAMRTMAAGLHGGMTSPARPWFRLGLEDEDLAQYHDVQQWLGTVARRMLSVYHRSNFYNAMHNVYAELGTFGTAYLMELADLQNGFRFIPFTAGEYCLDANERLRVDVVFRRFEMTARQIIRQFGEQAVPEYVKQAANANTWSQRQFVVCHAVYPRDDRDTRRYDGTNKAFVSVYWLESGSMSGGQYAGQGGTAKPHLLREHGFDEFPGFGIRWDVVGNDVYGKSPAMDVLADCRMLQQMGMTTLKAVHKSVDPPTSVSAGLKAVGLDLTPGGVNYVDTQPGQAPQAATPILQIRPEIREARLAIQDVQRQIQQGLYNDLFRMLLGSNRAQITAREVAAREEEKLILIGPVLERLHDELFIPLIDRTFNIMTRLDMLPTPPPELAGTEIKVEFISLLAQAQKMVSTAGVDQMLGFVVNAANSFPEVLDAVNIDNAVDNYADYLGVEVNLLRPQQEREQVRKARTDAQAAMQQQAQAAAATQSLGNAAQTARTLSQTPVGADGKTALEAIAGGLGGPAV